MTRKLLFILRHEEPKDDLKFINNIVKSQVAEVKILLMNENYLFDYSKQGLISSMKMGSRGWVSMNTEEGIREISEEYLLTELKTILKHGVEVGYDNRLRNFDVETFKGGSSVEYLQYLTFTNSGIKRVNAFQYVTDAIRDGYEIIKW